VKFDDMLVLLRILVNKQYDYWGADVYILLLSRTDFKQQNSWSLFTTYPTKASVLKITLLHSHLSSSLQDSANLVSSAHAWLNPWSHSKIQEASSLSRDLTAIDRGQHDGAEN
jgi:hypothetical protein